MKIRTVACSPRCALACAALVWLGQPACAAANDALARNLSPSVLVQSFSFAAATAEDAVPGSATNTPNLQRTTHPPPVEVDSHTRSKAGFMAGAGLAILSLLILAAGLALLRAFRQR